MRKVQRVRDEFGGAIGPLKRGRAADVSAREGGVVLQIFPVVGDLAA
jgi:hypothetical protein